MDGSRRSSTDRPLLPLHAAQRPPSSADGRFPGSPTSHYQTPEPPVGNAEPEADIADSGAHVNENVARSSTDEKAEAISPTRRKSQGEPKAASLEDEQQALNWIVPVQNGMPPEKRRTVGERLESTLVVAKEEQAKYGQRAKLAGMAVNGAMFAQIIINALITGLSASTSNRNAQIGVSALGAIGTIVASFLVRVRGTREPERSVTHSQNLEKFIRELAAFILDEGLSRDRKWDSDVQRFRLEFDKLQTAVHQSENGQPMSEK